MFVRRTLASAGIAAPVLFLFAIVSPHGTTRAQSAPATFANFESSQTNPIRLSPDGTRLFAVNTPNNTVSVFDVTAPATPKLIAEIPVGIEPVSVNPRTDDEAWVVSQVSNSLSVISVSKGIVTDTIQIKTEPMDVVFAGVNQAYVSVSRANAIAVFDTNSHALITTLNVFGGNPRAMAVSPDGSMVYSAFALSGNATTLIPAYEAPPPCTTDCVPAINPALPAPPQVSRIVSATDPNYSSLIKYQMPDNDVVAITTGPTPAIQQYYSGVGTLNLGLAVNPTSGDLFVANTDSMNLVQFEPNVRGHFANNRITKINVTNGQITPVDLNPGVDYSVMPNPSALATALAQPTAVVFDPSGSFMWVAAFGTDRVAKVDTNGQVLAFVEIEPTATGSGIDTANKRGPRGLALQASQNTLYSLNRISNTISIISTPSNSVTSEIPVGSKDPTPPAIRYGRGFLYDAKLSGNGSGSCATCHPDGDIDHLAWDLGDPTGSMQTVTQTLGSLVNTVQLHPMKGPMTTQTLHGLLNQSPYHWRGDHNNFAAFNPAFDTLMGGSQISNLNMTVYTVFVNSILNLPNPIENLDRSLPTSVGAVAGNAVNGEAVFMNVPGSVNNTQTCNFCHSENPGTGSNRFIEGAQKPQALKTPQLRNIYQKLLFNRYAAQTIDGFGLDHDGNTSGFTEFFAGRQFNYTLTQYNDMAAYMMAFDTGTAPAVGYAITLNSSTVTGSNAQTSWSTLQTRAAAGDIDLIVRGTLAGKVDGLIYQTSTQRYMDVNGLTFSRATLQALVQAGDTLTLMGAYPGTGAASTN